MRIATQAVQDAERSPDTVSVRTLVLLSLAALLCSCTSLEGSTADTDTWTTEVKQGSAEGRVAQRRAAPRQSATSMGTAYRGVTNGFEDPADKAYGPYPRDYVNTIRKHMIRFEDVARQVGLPLRQAGEAPT